MSLLEMWHILCVGGGVIVIFVLFDIFMYVIVWLLQSVF
jgi:hypothetical protein